IDSQALAGQLQHEKLREFARLCKRFEFAVNGTLSLEKACVTGGGVSVKEIHPKEMSSKFMQGLYFCGEI
ncbi:NAD(P)/FAD-dependent oxidoreductase, partial [Escherichia coli]|nr:NAD(P)/FAD-dependent oxidoreductase [Escherichia coli]